MSKEEAIAILKSLYPSHVGIITDNTFKIAKALRMAIEALSADSDCNNCKEYGSYKCTRCDGEIYHKTD